MLLQTIQASDALLLSSTAATLVPVQRTHPCSQLKDCNEYEPPMMSLPNTYVLIKALGRVAIGVRLYFVLEYKVYKVRRMTMKI